MKKMIVFMMVLSMAGIAPAALQIEVSGGKAMVTGQLDQDMYLILAAGNGATLSNFALGSAAPLMSGFFASAADFASVGTPIPAGFDGQGWVLASAPGEHFKMGTLLTADCQLTKSTQQITWEDTTVRL